MTTPKAIQAVERAEIATEQAQAALNDHRYQLRFIQLLDAGLSDEEADKIASEYAYGGQ